MAGLKFELENISLPNKPLGHNDVALELIGAKASYEGTQTLQGIGFTFGVETRAGVEAFNAPSDEDKDGVAGPPNDDPMLAPAVVLDQERAWLKYRVDTKAKVQAKAKFAPVSFKVDGNFGVVFTDFHAHDIHTSVGEAVAEDLTRLRFAGNPNDILELGQGEALSYQVRGELSASVTLSWSDVFTANLNALSGLLKKGAALALEIGGNVTVSVGTVDDFRVVFLNGGDGKTRVIIKKADARKLGVNSSFGLTLGFADPKAVKEALNGFIKAIAGEEIAAIDELIGQASLSALSDPQRKLIVALFERLGVKAEEQPWNALQAKWKELKDRAEMAIKQIAESKVSLGFKYEYARVKTGDTLLEVELDETRLRQFHNELMLCDTEGLLAWVGAHPESGALKRYLYHKKLTRTHAWGFTLGIGPWIKIGGLDKKELKAVIREDLVNNRKQIAYRGVREYSSSGFSDKDKWTSDFNAAMPKFSIGPEPTAAEFEYGLHFRFEWEEKKLSEGEIDCYVDHACIWRALNIGQAEEVKKAVGDRMGRKAKVSVDLKFNDELLRKLLPLAASLANDQNAGNAAGARALARAMPYWSIFEARQNPLFREVCYAPLWKFYFEHDDLFAGAYAPVAAKWIRDLTDIPEHQLLATHEAGVGGQPVYQNPNTFAGQIYLNGSDSDNDYSVVHDCWKAFLDELRRLNHALAPGNSAPHQEIEKVFKGLSRFWSQSLFVRAAGAFLIDLAATQNALLSKLERSMTVSLIEGEGEVILFATSLGSP
ncbi:MAG TPA: hypothetical protein VJ810_05260 [Blastocatellia bacterium]|nr:hypothetical protein [Blastocatellia bacterium]